MFHLQLLVEKMHKFCSLLDSGRGGFASVEGGTRQSGRRTVLAPTRPSLAVFLTICATLVFVESDRTKILTVTIVNNGTTRIVSTTVNDEIQSPFFSSQPRNVQRLLKVEIYAGNRTG